jgi:hypothetical protein
MRVRILRAPPARILEGVDLGSYRFEPGGTYEIERRVAEVLIVWNYAERLDPNAVLPAGDKQPL